MPTDIQMNDLVNKIDRTISRLRSLGGSLPDNPDNSVRGLASKSWEAIEERFQNNLAKGQYKDALQDAGYALGHLKKKTFLVMQDKSPAFSIAAATQDSFSSSKVVGSFFRSVALNNQNEGFDKTATRLAKIEDWLSTLDQALNPGIGGTIKRALGL